MSESENSKQVTKNHLPLSQFAGGLINADIVNAQHIGGDIYNIHLGQQTAVSGNQNKQQQKILILAAIPHGLRLDREIREIEDAIKRATRRDLFEVRIRTAVRPQDIRRAIAEERPCIVHFCGHGLEDGSLLLEDDGGNNKPVAPAGLASLFKLHADYVNCVLLNACYSAKPAHAISQNINYASYQDKQYLAASKEKEIQENIAAKEQEAALERERKDKEALETRNQLLSKANQKLAEANQKAQQRIHIGSIILVLTLVGAGVSIIWAGKNIQEIRKTTEQISTLSKLSEELYRKGKLPEASRAREQIGLAYEFRDYEFKKVVLLTFIAQAHQRLENWDRAENAIKESLDILKSHSKVVALMTMNNSMDGKAFEVFIEKFLVPELWSGAVDIN